MAVVDVYVVKLSWFFLLQSVVAVVSVLWLLQCWICPSVELLRGLLPYHINDFLLKF